MKTTMLRYLLFYLPCSYLADPSDVQPTKTRACDILIGIDDNLYELKEKNMSALVDLAQTHIDAVNKIYNKAVFVDEFSDVYFRLARVQVMFGSCDTFRYENCTENRDKFLEIFDQYDFTDFCLGFMFTYRDFDAGTAGLASIGTACRDRHNSGFITFLNYAVDRDFNDTVITLAHELAHSLGSLHDEDDDTQDCGEDFIMSSFLNHTINEEFSNCTVKSIHTKLDEVLSSDLNCIKEPTSSTLQVSLCGNGLVEAGEECDCGKTEVECNDPCCYPALISMAERNLNDSGALPCSTNQSPRCVSPSGVMFGVYLPLAFILVLIVLITVLLKHDWTRDKTLFSHVTKADIRIVPSKRRGGHNRLQEPRGNRQEGDEIYT